MQKFAIIIALFVFSVSCLSGKREVVQIFSETTYTVQEQRMWPRAPLEHKLTAAGAGTGFLVIYENKSFIVTAAHVISGSRGPNSITDPLTGKVFNRDSILSVANRIRVSDLSFTPIRIAVDAANDLAIIELHSDDLRVLTLQPLNLFRRSIGRNPDVVPPTIRTPVQLWGFPSSNQPQLVASGVAISSVEGNFFVLNQPMLPGFSGGPVINSDQFILGVVSRSTNNQTRSVSNKVIVDLLANFETQSRPYRDGGFPPF